MRMKNLLKQLVPLCLIGINMAFAAGADSWLPVTGAEQLRDFMSGLKAERTLPTRLLFVQ